MGLQQDCLVQNTKMNETQVEKLELPTPGLDCPWSCGVAFLSLGVHLESLEELLEVHGPPDDLTPADGAVVGVQLDPAVATHEVAPGTLEHLEVSAVLHVTDLGGDNHGGEIKRDETYRALRESLLEVDEVQAPDQLLELRVVVIPEL